MSVEIIKKAYKIVGKLGKAAAFGLVDENGFPFVSTVVALKNYGFREFWISTGPKSRKTQLIKENEKAGLCYRHKNSNITLYGVAEIVDDLEKKEELWLKWMKNYFPGGPQDENYVLIKFTVQKSRLCINNITKDFSIEEMEEAIKWTQTL
jgi:general stress protein 26